MVSVQCGRQRNPFLKFLFLSGVVDVGYSASAPMKFYSGELTDQFDYYKLITDSAERSVKGCSNAVRSSVEALHQVFRSQLLYTYILEIVGTGNHVQSKRGLADTDIAGKPSFELPRRTHKTETKMYLCVMSPPPIQYLKT